MTSKYPYQLSLLQAKERRVNQSVCGEILEYGTSMFKWHDKVYIGRDLPSQPANHTPNSNRSKSKSHLKAASLQGEREEDIVARVSHVDYKSM